MEPQQLKPEINEKNVCTTEWTEIPVRSSLQSSKDPNCNCLIKFQWSGFPNPYILIGSGWDLCPNGMTLCIA